MGRQGVVAALLSQDGENPNSRDRWGCTPLEYAAGNKHLEIVNYYLRMGLIPRQSMSEARHRSLGLFKRIMQR
jgi:ankyrin repeat protein